VRALLGGIVTPQYRRPRLGLRERWKLEEELLAPEASDAVHRNLPIGLGGLCGVSPDRT